MGKPYTLHPTPCPQEKFFQQTLISDHPRLSEKICRQIKNSNNEVFLSVVSVWECVIKYQLGKLNFPERPDLYLPKKRKQHLINSLVIDEKSLVH